MSTLKKLILFALSFSLILSTSGAYNIVYAASNDSTGETRALAVDPTGRGEGFSTVLYNNTNGLPTSEANDIVETKDGFIWIGSYAGLIRYDGNTFERMYSTNGISSIKCLFTDSKERLWIGTNDNGVAVLENGVLRKWGKLDGMRSAHTRAITEDKSGNIYVATTSGITIFDPDYNSSFMDDPAIATADMRDVQLGNDEVVYGVTDTGDLMMIRDGKLIKYVSAADNPLKGAGTIMPDPDRPGCIYQEAADFGLYHVDLNDDFRIIEKIDVSPLSYLMQLKYIDGKIWVCAGNGIGVLENGKFTLLDNLIMSNNVGHVMKDYLGNLWFTSTRQGVMKVVPNRFQDLFAKYDLPSAVVNSTCMYEDKLFIGTDTGLMVLGAEGSVTTIPITKAETASGKTVNTDDLVKYLEGSRIRSIIKDSKDGIWISTWRTNGLLRFSHGELTVFDTEEGLLSNNIRAISETQDGSVLVALTGGVNVIKDGKVTAAYGEKDGIKDKESLTVCEGPGGEIVLGSNGGGIYIFGPEGMKSVNVEEGLPSDIVMRLKLDKKRNIIWIVTSGAIAFMDADYNVTTIKEFPYTNNFDLFENSRGDMWVASSNGMYVVPTDELLANGEINPVYYSISNGLPCITTANSYSDLTADGNLYIAGSTGVCKVNIEEIFEELSELKASVPFIEVDGQIMYPNDSGSFTIPANAMKLTIYSFVFNYSLNNPTVIYQLEGFDSRATAVNRSEMTPVYYTNLRGGTYHYTMQLRDSMGRGNKVVSVEIIKEKKLYENLWFMIPLCLILLILLVEVIRLINKRKLRILEEKNQETMRQNRILQESEEKLKSQMDIISSIAKIYNSMYELDLENNTYRELQAGYASTADVINNDNVDLQQVIDLMIKTTIDESCIDEDLTASTQMATIDQRMHDSDTWTREVMNPLKQWRRGRIIVSKRDENGHISRILWVTEDIDKEKKDRERLIDMSERAVAASEAKSSFLSNMSHEIRTPINAVLGMNEMILRESSEDNILEYAECVRTSGNTLLGLINDILDFSKIEAGKMEIIPVEYDLSSVINDLVNMIQTRAEDKGLLLNLDISKEIPKFLYGDEVRIKQVITNILTNAVKYTETGSVTFCVDYEKTTDDQVLLRVAVKDTGIGIKPEDMAKLFSEFDRIEEARNRKVEGTGLGMSITKKLLEMMGSSLEVESVYGEGSTFSFKVSQRVLKWDPLGDYEAAYRASLSQRKKYKEKFIAPEALVLVVDDIEMNLIVFKSLLKTTKVRIETALCGGDAIRMSGEKKYDMIFLDHMMPDKDGVETLHEIRDTSNGPNASTPVVCLTANAISGVREKYIAEGFDNYLSKPIDADKLEEMLMEYLPKDKVLAATEEASENAVINDVPDDKIPDWLISCNSLDARMGVKNCGGREEFLTVLTNFHATIRDKANMIEEYYKTDNLKNYIIEVHALKSSARIIGAGDLSEKARLLEKAGKEGNTDYIRENTDELLAKYRSYIEALSPIEDADEDLPDVPASVLEDAYAGLSEFTEAEDYELVRMVLHSMKEYKLPAEDKERFRQIQEKLALLDWDEIRSILK